MKKQKKHDELIATLQDYQQKQIALPSVIARLERELRKAESGEKSAKSLLDYAIKENIKMGKKLGFIGAVCLLIGVFLGVLSHHVFLFLK